MAPIRRSAAASAWGFNMSIPGALGTLIANIVTSPNQGSGVDAMGNFDTEDFVNSTLTKAMKTKGTNLPQVTQGITQLLGFGPKQLIGSVTQDSKPTGKLDYLDNVIQGLNK